MIKLVSAVGFAALMLSPAMAASPAKHHHARAGYAQSAPSYVVENDMGSSSAGNPVVVVAGQYIGRDPDADVRLDLRREAGNAVD